MVGGDEREARGPLAGIHVVDFSPYLPGLFASRALADLGAEVTKVEAPGGDPGAALMPAAHDFLNSGKEVVELDLKDAADRERAGELIGTADVVIESFRPGTADRLGIGFEDARRQRPDVVYCSISSYGQTGPRRDLPGHNIVYEAAGGSWAATLVTGVKPTGNPIAAADVSGSLLAALSIAARLADRDRLEAVHLDLSLEEALAFVAAPRWGRFLIDAETPDPVEFPFYAPGNALYETSDGAFVALAAVEDKFWGNLCEWLGRPDLAATPNDSHAGRMGNRAKLSAALEEEMGRRSGAEIAVAGEEHDFPVEFVRGFEDLRDDPHLLARGFFRAGVAGAQPDFPVVGEGGRRSFGRGRTEERR